MKKLSIKEVRKRKCLANKKWDLKNPEKAKLIRKKTYYKNRTSKLKAVEKWRKQNPKKYKQISDDAQRKYNYGIDKKQFELMIKQQKNKCAICRNIFIKTPHIDHCHKTNKVRGLLCSGCNHGLGFYKDNIMFILYAFYYLKKGGFNGKIK